MMVICLRVKTGFSATTGFRFAESVESIMNSAVVEAADDDDGDIGGDGV